MYSPNARDENGESVIPASQRPDGTWRKARRVKEGYVPQEEVPLYESKGKQFATRSTKPATVTLPTGQVAHQSIPGLFIVNEKEKSKNKKKSKNVENSTKQLEKLKISEKVNKAKTPTNNKSTKQEQAGKVASTEAVDPAKRLKNLNKRLREIEAIETKLKSGEISKPEPEQLTKVQRKNDLLLQIQELEKLL